MKYFNAVILIIVLLFLCGCDSKTIIYDYDKKIKEYKDINNINIITDSDKYQVLAADELKNIYVYDENDKDKINPLVLNESYYNPYNNLIENAYWINKTTNNEIYAAGIFSIENKDDILPIFMSEDFYNEFYTKIKNINETYIYDLETLYLKVSENDSNEEYEMLCENYPEFNLPKHKTFYLKRYLSYDKLPNRFIDLYESLGYSYKDTRKQNYLGGYSDNIEKYCIIEIILNKDINIPIKYNIFPISPENAEYILTYKNN